MTVAENIAFGLEMLGKPKAEVDPRVKSAEMLALVRMEALAEAPHQLSSRAASSSAWPWPARWPPPPACCCWTSRSRRLDLKLRKAMQIELKRMQNETGITFVFVTHDQEEALTMSDRIAVMSCWRTDGG
jgi:spermidine/putrescine transport system ATP-binding protein